MTQKPVKILADDLSKNILVNSLEKYDLLESCYFEKHKDDTIIVSCDTYEKQFKPPIRLGKVIDQIDNFRNKTQKQKTTFIPFGDSRLNTHLGVFITEGQKDIILTEKEVEILVYLSENKDRMVPREELLETVWNYAKDVETHTLETHIYRLRQKIETDPANPRILKTKENGYCV